MKQIFILFALFSTLSINIHAQVKIGGSGSPHPNAVLELDGGTNKGLLLPKHTNIEMINLMSSSPDGMLIYNTTDNKIYTMRNGSWSEVGGLNLPLNANYGTSEYVLRLVNNTPGSFSAGGIQGVSSWAGTGVAGYSDTGYGVSATSNTGIGLYASSNTGPGLAVASGNVGIGLVNPTVPLHVKKANASLLQLENSISLGAGLRNEIDFKSGNYYTGVIATVGTGTQTARMAFHTGAHTSAGFLIERMSIDNNGNIGINNNAPSAKLDVVGTAEFNTTSGEPAVKVNGTAQFIQGPGDEAAVNINGRIKMSGMNPRAFVVTANSTAYEIILDHPDLNNNPNAIILVTPRWIQGDIKYSGTIVVEYKTGVSKWALKAVGSTVNYYQELDIKSCSGACHDNVDIYNMIAAVFQSGDQFNVLVIGN